MFTNPVRLRIRTYHANPKYGFYYYLMVHNKRTLIVEDNLIFSMILDRMCTELGLHVIGVAHSENEAIELSRKYKPELILMDYQLKEGDGNSACKKIRAFLDAPIIFITGDINSRVQNALLNTQSSILKKPFMHEDLERIVTSTLGKSSSRPS